MSDAQRACELTKWESAVCLGAFAAAYAEAGQFAEAKKWQKAAIERSDKQLPSKDGEIVLKLYESGRPYRFYSLDLPKQ